jgi:phenylacetate-coenzyme A ligase PaaK-like adenylate-forming protein
MNLTLEQIIFSETIAFENKALQVFEYQYTNNNLYREFCRHLKKDPKNVLSIREIPFLPISFFKTHKISCFENETHDICFTSSGTTGTQNSAHWVKKLALYETSFIKGFEHFYGSVTDYTFLALLPSYLERTGSSLIYMMEHLIKQNNQKHNGFYLNEYNKLFTHLTSLESKKQKTILVGVTYALIDFATQNKTPLEHCVIMETGGMKGKRKEIIRKEVHALLSSSFNQKNIHSEYGMTELLSQAYSKGDGLFKCPPWMDILIRDPEDPLSLLENNKTGGINVIDLANLYSCAFIATQDLGKKHTDQSFEILGRFDQADVRGCNLMVL